MIVTLKADFEVNDSACREATGKSLSEWLAALEARGTDGGRRDCIQWLYNEMGRGKDIWWPTTVWVEYERSQGIVNKTDGLAEGYNICVTKVVKASAQPSPRQERSAGWVATRLQKAPLTPMTVATPARGPSFDRVRTSD